MIVKCQPANCKQTFFFKCRDRAIDSFNFRQLCLNSDENLRTICDKVTIKEEYKEEFEAGDEFFQIVNESFEELDDDQDLEGQKPRRKKDSYKKLDNSNSDCTICVKSFSSPSKLMRHLKAHKDLNDEEKIAMLEGRLVVKTISKSMKSRFYGCTVSDCEKSFESPSKLAR